MAWVRWTPPAIYLCNHHPSFLLCQFTVRTRHPMQLRHLPPPTTEDLAARTMVALLLSSMSSTSHLSTRDSSTNNSGSNGRERNGNVAIKCAPPANAQTTTAPGRGWADAPSLLTCRTSRHYRATEARDQQRIRRCCCCSLHPSLGHRCRVRRQRHLSRWGLSP